MNEVRIMYEWWGQNKERSFFGSTDWWPLKGPLNDCSNGNHWDEWNSRRPDDVKVSKRFMPSFRSSWAEEQLGCWEGHHLVQWWHRREVCSIPRRSWWRVGDVGEWSLSSCCHGQHYQPTRELQRPSIPRQQPGRLGHQLPLAQHSFPFEEVDGFDRLGTGVQLATIATWPLIWLFLPFLVQTC